MNFVIYFKLGAQPSVRRIGGLLPQIREQLKQINKKH